MKSRTVWPVVLTGLGLLVAAGLAGCGSSSSSSSPAPILTKVTDPSGAAVEGARVVLVKAEDVEAADSIQPMEDVAAAVVAGTNTNGYVATTAADGTYDVPTGVADGKYFVVVLPADTDTLHLPGANREAVSMTGGDFDTSADATLEISQTPSSSATYIGSTECLKCHAKTDLKHTLHFVGMRVVDASTGQTQANGLMNLADDVGPYALTTNANAGLADFTDPATKITLADTTDDAYLGKDADGLYFQIGSTTAPKYRVEATYGGETGKWKMRYMTLVGATDGLPADGWGAENTLGNGYGYFEMAPMQYQEEYTDGTDGVSGPYVAYHSDRWDFAGSATVAGQFTADVKAKSWDTNCATCHGGTQITTDSNGDRVVHFAPDTNGYELATGEFYQINIGCEKCHGPGSEHKTANGNGEKIVHPDLLTAGRLTMICGTCHLRGTNNTDLGGEPPLTSSDQLTFDVFRPGMNPAAFFGTTDGSGIAPFETDLLTTGYLSPINYATNKASWKDETYQSSNPFVTTTAAGDRTQVTGSFNHSKGHHQQFQDVVRTKMYKNDNELVTCIDCHDAHGGTLEHQLSADNDNNALCLVCHNDSLRAPDASAVAPTASTDTTADAAAALEGKHPANFQFISQAAADRLVAGSTTAADDASIAIEVMRHVGKWADDSAMAIMPYSPDSGTKMGRCSYCHMPKTSKSASFSNALANGSTQYLQGDIHSHTFDVETTEAVNAMQSDIDLDGAGTTPAGMTNACGTCHVSVLN